uniref:AraC family transcriptional regulator n=1 Tax=Panagrolaimus superbus TaxID=310955 RepID=A0A914YDT8_9BILA
MSGNFRQNLKDRMNKTLLDSENYHNTLQHGADIKEIYLNRYGFSSLDQFLAWFNKPIDYNFDHVQGVCFLLIYNV